MNYKKILIAVDGSSCSKNAAMIGLNLAQQLSASVIVLCVIDLSGAINSTAISGEIGQEMITAFHDEAERIVKEIAGKSSTDKITTLTVEGVPQYEVGNIAKTSKADMVIIGTHGRTGLKHLVMGSVAEYVVRHSEVPVLVIPESKS